MQAFDTTTLNLPTTDTAAIDFALSHLEPWEVAMFLKDWREGKDLRGWLPDHEDDAAG